MNDKLRKIFKDPVTFPVNGIDFIAIGVVALGTGLGIGYILGRKAKNKVHPVPERVIFDVENFIEDQEKILKEKEEKKKKPGRYTPPKPKKEKAPVVEESIVIERIYVPEVPEDAPITNKIEAINEDGTFKLTEVTPYGDEWDYSIEVLSRSSHEPYIIHHDEFHADELAYTQSTLTYYSGDDILVDEDLSPIYNHERVVGELKFGHGSMDPNVVYIRNDKRKSEYEILCDPGLYSSEVLGIYVENNQRAHAKEQREMKHSHNRTRFRQE